jgi:hypothetical protein
MSKLEVGKTYRWRYPGLASYRSFVLISVSVANKTAQIGYEETAEIYVANLSSLEKFAVSELEHKAQQSVEEWLNG